MDCCGVWTVLGFLVVAGFCTTLPFLLAGLVTLVRGDADFRSPARFMVLVLLGAGSEVFLLTGAAVGAVVLVVRREEAGELRDRTWEGRRWAVDPR